jgi:hypothetical protein
MSDEELVLRDSLARRITVIIFPGVILAMVAAGLLPVAVSKLHSVWVGSPTVVDPRGTAGMWGLIGAGGLLAGLAALWIFHRLLWRPHLRVDDNAIQLPGGHRIAYEQLRRLGVDEFEYTRTDESTSYSGVSRTVSFQVVFLEWETEDGSREREKLLPDSYQKPDPELDLGSVLEQRTGLSAEPLHRHLFGLYYTFDDGDVDS